MNKKVIIIDYKLGNLFSVNQALSNIGLNTRVTTDPGDIADAAAIILPGVGAFADAVKNIDEQGLRAPMERFVRDGKPFMGICLGLQLLFSESEEFGSTPGLNFLEGKVVKFKSTDPASHIRVPQINWNNIYKPANRSWQNTPFQDIKNGEDMYFVHSYYIKPNDQSVILSETEYSGINYASSISKDNIFACQFHPEKSAAEGLKIYKKWAILNNLI